MVKTTKKPVKVVKRNFSSLSSSSSSSLSSSAQQVINCTPPTVRNGALRNDRFILSPEEQTAFKKYITEIKQVSGLIILKCGLGVQECKVISQKLQDDYFSKNL